MTPAPGLTRPAIAGVRGARAYAAETRYRTGPLAGPPSGHNLENCAMGKTRHVKDLMNPDVMTVADEMTTDELARYLTEREI